MLTYRVNYKFGCNYMKERALLVSKQTKTNKNTLTFRNWSNSNNFLGKKFATKSSAYILKQISIRSN